MNMTSMKMLVVFASMGVIGYMYMKKHPEMIKMMKDMVDDSKDKLEKTTK